MHQDAPDLTQTFARVARELMQQGDLLGTLERIVELAVETIDGCDFAGLSLIRGREIESPAQSDEMVAVADRLQVDLGEGPCLSAIREEHTVVVEDLTVDRRWPTWGPRVCGELGVRSMLAFQLYNSEDSLGALNLYSKRINAFNEASLRMGLVFASHAAVALTGAQAQENLQRAVQTRNVIGQAQGILMERFAMAADKAFDLLRRISQNENIKLRDVAVRLVTTGQAPGLPQPSTGRSGPTGPTAA